MDYERDFPATQVICDDDDIPATQPFTSTQVLEDHILIGTLDIDGKKHSIFSGTTTIGRHPLNNVVINDESVSKNHAEIEAISSESTIFIKDLKSSNKTKVNNKDLKPLCAYQIQNGDKIIFGKVTSYFRIPTVIDDSIILDSPVINKHVVIPSTPDSPLDNSTVTNFDDSIIQPSQNAKVMFQKSQIPTTMNSLSNNQIISSIGTDSYNTSKINEDLKNIDADDEDIFDMDTQKVEVDNTNDINLMETQHFGTKCDLFKLKAFDDDTLRNFETQKFDKSDEVFKYSKENIIQSGGDNDDYGIEAIENDLNQMETQKFKCNENIPNESIEMLETQLFNIPSKKLFNNKSRGEHFDRIKTKVDNDVLNDIETQKFESSNENIEMLETQIFDTSSVKSLQTIHKSIMENNTNIDSADNLETQKFVNDIHSMETQKISANPDNYMCQSNVSLSNKSPNHTSDNILENLRIQRLINSSGLENSQDLEGLLCLKNRRTKDERNSKINENKQDKNVNGSLNDNFFENIHVDKLVSNILSSTPANYKNISMNLKTSLKNNSPLSKDYQTDQVSSVNEDSETDEENIFRRNKSHISNISPLIPTINKKKISLNSGQAAINDDVIELKSSNVSNDDSETDEEEIFKHSSNSESIDHGDVMCKKKKDDSINMNDSSFFTAETQIIDNSSLSNQNNVFRKSGGNNTTQLSGSVNNFQMDDIYSANTQITRDNSEILKLNSNSKKNNFDQKAHKGNPLPFNGNATAFSNDFKSSQASDNNSILPQKLVWEADEYQHTQRRNEGNLINSIEQNLNEMFAGPDLQQVVEDSVLGTQQLQDILESSQTANPIQNKSYSIKTNNQKLFSPIKSTNLDDSIETNLNQMFEGPVISQNQDSTNICTQQLKNILQSDESQEESFNVNFPENISTSENKSPILCRNSKMKKRVLSLKKNLRSSSIQNSPIKMTSISSDPSEEVLQVNQTKPHNNRNKIPVKKINFNSESVGYNDKKNESCLKLVTQSLSLKKKTSSGCKKLLNLNVPTGRKIILKKGIIGFNDNHAIQNSELEPFLLHDSSEDDSQTDDEIDTRHNYQVLTRIISNKTNELANENVPEYIKSSKNITNLKTRSAGEKMPLKRVSDESNSVSVNRKKYSSPILSDDNSDDEFLEKLPKFDLSVSSSQREEEDRETNDITASSSSFSPPNLTKWKLFEHGRFDEIYNEKMSKVNNKNFFSASNDRLIKHSTISQISSLTDNNELESENKKNCNTPISNKEIEIQNTSELVLNGNEKPHNSRETVDGNNFPDSNNISETDSDSEDLSIIPKHSIIKKEKLKFKIPIMSDDSDEEFQNIKRNCQKMLSVAPVYPCNSLKNKSSSSNKIYSTLTQKRPIIKDKYIFQVSKLSQQENKKKYQETLRPINCDENDKNINVDNNLTLSLEKQKLYQSQIREVAVVCTPLPKRRITTPLRYRDDSPVCSSPSAKIDKTRQDLNKCSSSSVSGKKHINNYVKSDSNNISSQTRKLLLLTNNSSDDEFEIPRDQSFSSRTSQSLTVCKPSWDSQRNTKSSSIKEKLPNMKNNSKNLVRVSKSVKEKPHKIEKSSIEKNSTTFIKSENVCMIKTRSRTREKNEMNSHYSANCTSAIGTSESLRVKSKNGNKFTKVALGVERTSIQSNKEEIHCKELQNSLNADQEARSIITESYNQIKRNLRKRPQNLNYSLKELSLSKNKTLNLGVDLGPSNKKEKPTKRTRKTVNHDLGTTVSKRILRSSVKK